MGFVDLRTFRRLSMCENLISSIQKMLNNKCAMGKTEEELTTNIIAAYLNKESGDDEIILTECPMGALLKDKNQKGGKVDLACLDISGPASSVKWVAEAKPSPFGIKAKKKTEWDLQKCFNRFFGKDGESLKDKMQADEKKLQKLHDERINCYYIMYIKRKTDGGGDIHIEDWNIELSQEFGSLKLELIQIIRAREGAKNEFQGALLWKVL